jgi:hypothetical protein
MFDFGTKKVWKEKNEPIYKYDLVGNDGIAYKKIRFYDDAYVVKVSNEGYWDVYVFKQDNTKKSFAVFNRESDISLRQYFLMTTICLSEREPSHYELIDGGLHA